MVGTSGQNKVALFGCNQEVPAARTEVAVPADARVVPSICPGSIGILAVVVFDGDLGDGSSAWRNEPYHMRLDLQDLGLNAASAWSKVWPTEHR
jgi:hypothetical protein